MWVVAWLSCAQVNVKELLAIVTVVLDAVKPWVPVNVNVRTPVAGTYDASLTVNVPPILLVTPPLVAETKRWSFSTTWAVTVAPRPPPPNDPTPTVIESSVASLIAKFNPEDGSVERG